MDVGFSSTDSLPKEPLRASRVQRLAAFKEIVYSGCWEDT